MVESLSVSEGNSEIEELKAAIARLSGSGDEAEAIAPQLRVERRALAERFCGLSDEEARTQFAGPRGEAHRLFVHSGLRDLGLDGSDEAIAAAALDALRAGEAPPCGALLAAMLLFHAFEIPLQEDLRRIPDWLLPDYARFLVVMPRVFN